MFRFAKREWDLPPSQAMVPLCPLVVPKIVCSLLTSHNFDHCASSARSSANRFFALLKKLNASLCFLSPKKHSLFGDPEKSVPLPFLAKLKQG